MGKRLNVKRRAYEARKARAFTPADAATAKRLLLVGIHRDSQRDVAQALRDERMGERARCTRIVQAVREACSDPASGAALQFAASQINASPLSSAKQSKVSGG